MVSRQYTTQLLATTKQVTLAVCWVSVQHPGVGSGFGCLSFYFFKQTVCERFFKNKRKQFELFKHSLKKTFKTATSWRFHTHCIVQRHEHVGFQLPAVCVANTFCLTCFAGGATECVLLFLLETVEREVESVSNSKHQTVLKTVQ